MGSGRPPAPVPRNGAVITNTAPAFSADTATRTVPENSADAVAVGDPVTATDGDGDRLIYTLQGHDAAFFAIDASRPGQITARSGVGYNFEAKASYVMTLQADDGKNGADTIAVTINLTDVDEPPLAPAVPTVSAVDDSSDSLSVSWTAPDNTGKPDIESYDLQYRQGVTGDWLDGPQNQTATTATITGLDAGSEYQVQVRATNDEGDGEWSPSGTASTHAIATITSMYYLRRRARRRHLRPQRFGHGVGRVQRRLGDEPLGRTPAADDAAGRRRAAAGGPLRICGLLW